MTSIMQPVDQVIASIGLPHHPPLKDIVETLRDAADIVHTHGPKAIALARELAATGYPSSTLGDGGSRGTDATSSTERAAGLGGREIDKHKVSRWSGVDAKLAAAYATASKAAEALNRLVADIVQHAEDVDPVPVGTGYCQACVRFCRPDRERPGMRLVAGLCPTDYRAWRRYVLNGGLLNHADWIHQRKQSFTDGEGVVHTPEPDHDIDLSTELPSA